MAQPSALQNRVRIWINAIETVEATDIDIQQPKPIGQKFGAAGLIGSYRGQAGSRYSFTFAQPDDKSQFEAFAMAQEDPKTGFVLVFTKGSSKFMSQFCFAGDASMRGNYETGDTSSTMAVIGGPMKQIA